LSGRALGFLNGGDFLKKFIALSLTFIICMIPFSSFAENSLQISNWIVDSNLKENGNLQISEDITFNFKDEFNGVYRFINYDKIQDVANLKVYGIVDGEEIEFNFDENAENGDTNVYNYEESENGLNIKIFSPSNDEQKTFRLKYDFVNAAVVHKDTGELYYKFIGNENETDVDHFSATISLPQFDKNRIRIFGHGPLNGNINFTDDNKIRLEVDDVSSNTFVEARVLYPPEYVPFSNIAGNNTLDGILQEEKEFAEEIAEKESRKQNVNKVLNSVSAIFLVIGLAVIGFVLKKFKRDPEIYNNMASLYPKDLSPAELNLFMNSAINSRGMLATIFDLSRRGYLTIDVIENPAAKKRYRKEDYLFIDTGKRDSELLSHESFLLDWFINEIGDGNQVSTNDIDKYRSKRSNIYSKKYNSWMTLVKKELDNKGYNDPISSKFGFILLLLSFVFLIIGIVSVVYKALYGIGSILIGVFFLVYGFILISRKSDEGYIQHGLWKDFKKEVESLGKIDIGIPKDKNMINAMALGVNMEDLDNYRVNVDDDYYPMYWGLWYFTRGKKGGSTFEDNFNASFYGDTGSSTGTSTNFGGGGGFSGGGGGGSGGGGAGGF